MVELQGINLFHHTVGLNNIWISDMNIQYPVLIERGFQGTAWGIIVPDLPGCFSAADILNHAREAIPQPSSLNLLIALDLQSDWSMWIWHKYMARQSALISPSPPEFWQGLMQRQMQRA